MLISTFIDLDSYDEDVPEDPEGHLFLRSPTISDPLIVSTIPPPALLFVSLPSSSLPRTREELFLYFWKYTWHVARMEGMKDLLLLFRICKFVELILEGVLISLRTFVISCPFLKIFTNLGPVISSKCSSASTKSNSAVTSAVL